MSPSLPVKTGSAKDAQKESTTARILGAGTHECQDDAEMIANVFRLGWYR